MLTKYDYLIVSSGVFGAMFAYCAQQFDKGYLVIDKRPHFLGSNVYREEIEGVLCIRVWHSYVLYLISLFGILSIREKM